MCKSCFSWYLCLGDKCFLFVLPLLSLIFSDFSLFHDRLLCRFDIGWSLKNIALTFMFINLSNIWDHKHIFRIWMYQSNLFHWILCRYTKWHPMVPQEDCRPWQKRQAGTDVWGRARCRPSSKKRFLSDFDILRYPWLCSERWIIRCIYVSIFWPFNA